MSLPYHVVDVFTRTPLEGNALAVFPDACDLDAATMQQIARELNLSETAFILPADPAGTRVRIFTPAREMDFAGHPTIGTAYMMRRLGIVPANVASFDLHENAGPIAVRVDAGEDPILWLTSPSVSEVRSVPADACAAALSLDEVDLRRGVPCEILTAGNPSIFVCVNDVTTVDRASIDTAALKALLRDAGDTAFMFVFAATPSGAYSRMFAPEHGVVEDPATGSATGPLAAFMMKHGLVPRADGTRFTSEQGTKMGRRSVLHVLIHGDGGSDGIEIGGHVTHIATAQLTL